jgi:hypothetical protein
MIVVWKKTTHTNHAGENFTLILTQHDSLEINFQIREETLSPQHFN